MKSNKGKSIFGLKKIEDADLLRLANIEIGKLKSYIDELIYDQHLLKKELFELKSLPLDELKVAKKEYLNSKLEKQRSIQIQTLESKLKKLKKEYDNLFARYVLLKEEKDGRHL